MTWFRTFMLVGMAALGALMLTSFAGDVAADRANEFQLFLFEENRVYEVGDEVQLELRLYELENPTDAEEINVTIGRSYLQESRYLGLGKGVTREAPGIYRIAFNLTAEDVKYHELRIEVRCKVKSETSGYSPTLRQSTYLDVVPLEEELPRYFMIEVTADKLAVAPGDNLTFSIQFINDTKPIDPNLELVNLDLTLFDQEIEGNGSLLTKVSTGNYTYSLALPENLDKAGFIKLFVSALWAYDNGGGTSSVGYARAKFEPYRYWLHTESFTNTGFEGEFYVADTDGHALSGVPVTAKYLYETDVEPRGEYRVSQWVNGTTDERGRVEWNFSFENLDTSDDIQLTIYVNGTYSERLKYDLNPRQEFEPREPWGDDLEVYVQQIPLLEKGKAGSYLFRVYQSSEPLVEATTLVYAVVSGYEAFQKGIDPIFAIYNLTTDNTGNLTLNIPASQGKCQGRNLFFKVENERGYWYFDKGYLVCLPEPDTSLDIEVKSFELGNQATIEVSGPKGDQIIGFVWLSPIGNKTSVNFSLTPDDLEPYPSDVVSWLEITEPVDGYSSFLRYLKEMENGSATFNITLPDFYPDDENYLIIAGWVNLSSPWEGDVGFNYIIVNSTGVVVEDNGSEENGDNKEEAGFLPGFHLVSALIILGTVAVACRRP